MWDFTITQYLNMYYFTKNLLPFILQKEFHLLLFFFISQKESSIVGPGELITLLEQPRKNPLHDFLFHSQLNPDQSSTFIHQHSHFQGKVGW